MNIPAGVTVEDVVTLAWQLGRDYGHAEIADHIEEAHAVPLWLPPARPWEAQVAQRLAQMEAGMM